MYLIKQLQQNSDLYKIQLEPTRQTLFYSKRLFMVAHLEMHKMNKLIL